MYLWLLFIAVLFCYYNYYKLLSSNVHNDRITSTEHTYGDALFVRNLSCIHIAVKRQFKISYVSCL
jgi:hypothetical protein